MCRSTALPDTKNNGTKCTGDCLLLSLVQKIQEASPALNGTKCTGDCLLLSLVQKIQEASTALNGTKCTGDCLLLYLVQKIQETSTALNGTKCTGGCLLLYLVQKIQESSTALNGTKCTGYNIGLRLSPVECVRVLPIMHIFAVFFINSKISSFCPFNTWFLQIFHFRLICSSDSSTKIIDSYNGLPRSFLSVP
jgi:hypothetical protein